MKKIYFFFFLISLNFSVAQDGTIDASFNTNVNAAIDFGTASVIVQQPDGKILVGGYFSISGSPRSIIRLNIDGTMDNSFASVYLDGYNAPAFNMYRAYVRSIALQPDGKIIVGGTFYLYNNTINTGCIIRLNNDGSYDSSFNNLGFQFPSGGGGINKILLQNNKIIIAGRFTKYGETFQKHIIRVNYDGTLDNSFNISTWSPDTFDIINTVIQKSDGNLLLGGKFYWSFIHLNSDGYFLGPPVGGSFTNGPEIRCVIEQFDGKVVCGGTFNFQDILDDVFLDIKGVTRLQNNYTSDSSYSINIGINFGEVNSILQQSDGKIVLFGSFTQFNETTVNRIVRLNIDGSIDHSFNSAGFGFGGSAPAGDFSRDGCILKQTDGKILVGGGFETYNGTPVKAIVRLNNPSVLSNSDFSKSKISLYPNPVNEILNLSNNEIIEKLTIYDVTGKNVLELKDISNHQIDVSSLEKGVYIIEIKTQNGLFKEKVVKN